MTLKGKFTTHSGMVPNKDTSTEYSMLENNIQHRVNVLLINNEPVFTTDASGLFELFLRNLPYDQQTYNCRTCKKFFDDYGNLVIVDKDTNETIPLLWGSGLDGFFDASRYRLNCVVKSAMVLKPFIAKSRKLGSSSCGGWSHLHVVVPKYLVNDSRILTTQQKIAEKLGEYQNVSAYLFISDVTVTTLQYAKNILNSQESIRGKKFIPELNFLVDVLESRSKLSHHKFDMWLRRYVALAPSGFCHINSSTLGSLIKDILAGTFSRAEIIERFNGKMGALQYQRTQTAPTAGNVIRAEQMFEKMGLEDSLYRRFATWQEVSKFWTPEPVIATNSRLTHRPNSMFACVATKTKEVDREKHTSTSLTPIKLSWYRFSKTILPNAKSMLIDTGNTRDDYCGILTALNPNSKPIFKHDQDYCRNQFSHYLYNRGCYPSKFNLTSNSWVKVTGLSFMPNEWDASEHNAVIFLLQGAKDLDLKGTAIFPELLRGDLREVKKVIEKYSASDTAHGKNEASACGYMYSGKTSINAYRPQYNTQESLTIEVVDKDNYVQRYILDRWE